MNKIELTKKIILDPNNDSLYLKRGHTYFQEGCSEEAIKDYTKALELNPMNANSWMARACAYETIHNHAQAIEDLTKAIDLDHKCHYYYVLRAISYMLSGKHNLDIFCDTFIKLDINKIEVKIFDVNVIHDLSHAIRDFKKAIKFYPNSTKEIEPLSFLATSYELCGRYYETVYFRQFKKNIEIVNKKILLKAINSYNKAINIDANNPRLYLLRSHCYYSLNNYQNAIKDYTKVIDLNPDISKNYDANPYFHRGICYYKIGDHDKALEDFSALKFDFNLFEILELGIKNKSFIQGDEYFTESTNTLMFVVNILGEPSCPIDLFLKGLEIIFELKGFSFYNKSFFESYNEDIFSGTAAAYNLMKFNENNVLYLSQYKLKVLENISKEILKEISLLSQEKNKIEFRKYVNIILLFFKLNEILQGKYSEIIRKNEQEKAQVKIDERNKVIADLSHSIKNLISSVIDPLENLKKEVIAKQPIIDSAIKGANLVREIVNAMNLSYKGSIEDFRYDAKNNEGGDRQNVQIMIIESLKNAVGNMYDGKYFPSFQEGYFPTKELYLESKSNWISITQSKSLDELCQFLHTYFFDLIISIENTEKLVVGNEKGSIIKFFILFGELILNAVKYSAFVKRENRFVKIEVLYNSKDVSVLVENRFNPRKKIKTTGLGNVIITNFAKLLNTSPVINTENDIYSIKITFENFWQKGSSL